MLRNKTFVLAMERAIITIAALHISVISTLLPTIMLSNKPGTSIKTITNSLGAATIITTAITAAVVVIRMSIVIVAAITGGNLTKALRMGASDRALHQRKS